MAGTGNDETRFNVDVLADELKILIQITDLTTPSKRSIFRVPNILYRHNPRAYEPNAFSIGPYHHHKPHLKAAQKIKLGYLQSLLSRFRRTNPDAMLRRLTQAIAEDLQFYYDCFADPIDMNMDEFLKLLLLDGCFLVELFMKKEYKYLREEDDPIFTVSCMYEFLHHDLILLENQIPWRVLHCVYDTTEELHRHVMSLTELAVRFFHAEAAIRSAIQTASNDRTNGLHNIQSKHILDLLRNAMVLPFLSKTRKDIEFGVTWQAIPSAAALEEAGIRFRKPDPSESILGVNFSGGVLEIPRLYVTEITEPLFRNLISYEQCLPNCKSVVTSYAVLMDNLINTAADTEVLCKNEVIDNWLSTEDTTKFFNQLYYDTYVKDYHYATLEHSVNKYCRRRWPKYRRLIVHHYFKHPWAIISLSAGVLLLLLTFLETLYTITKN